MSVHGKLLLRHQRPFIAFWCARVLTASGFQMLAVAIGWQMYDLTGSAWDLGLVGLLVLQFDRGTPEEREAALGTPAPRAATPPSPAPSAA